MPLVLSPSLGSLLTLAQWVEGGDPHPGRPLPGSWKSSFMGFLSATASMRPPSSIGLSMNVCFLSQM